MRVNIKGIVIPPRALHERDRMPHQYTQCEHLVQVPEEKLNETDSKREPLIMHKQTLQIKGERKKEMGSAPPLIKKKIALKIL